jgi:hypothetical protein
VFTRNSVVKLCTVICPRSRLYSQLARDRLSICAIRIRHESPGHIPVHRTDLSKAQHRAALAVPAACRSTRSQIQCRGPFTARSENSNRSVESKSASSLNSPSFCYDLVHFLTKQRSAARECDGENLSLTVPRCDSLGHSRRYLRCAQREHAAGAGGLPHRGAYAFFPCASPCSCARFKMTS